MVSQLTNDAVTPNALRVKIFFFIIANIEENESGHEMVAYLSKFFCPGDVPDWGAPNGRKR